MLFYSGLTRKIGDVDKGDTMMDYLPEERERGITITSACVTFGWKDHKINLIDTPGHVDFTIEVERAIRILDGAITILDGVAGVEAQTENVWQQANHYSLPRIVFVNKMDRVGASFENSVSEIKEKLQTTPILLQIPFFKENVFAGVIDVIEEKLLVWTDQKGQEFVKLPLPDDYKNLITKKRNELLEQLADYDDQFLEKYLDNSDSITFECIKESIKKLTFESKVVPVFCGASFRNIGVQPLLDGVLEYLPSPKDRPLPIGTNSKNEILKIDFNENNKLVALAYKVVNDHKRGILTFVRVYSGILNSHFTLYNGNRHVKERISKIYNVYADKFEPTEAIYAGNIGVIIGAKNTCTGDTLLKYEDQDKITLNGINIPPPVFCCSVEPNSLSDEKPLMDALKLIEMEDPSFKVETNLESGQTLMSGMGELHLEIIQNKLLNEYKINATVGKMQISFHETVEDALVEKSIEFEREISGKISNVHLALSFKKTNGPNEIIIPKKLIDRAKQSSTDLDQGQIYQSIQDGIEIALNYGPLGFPVDQVCVELTNLKIYPNTNPTSLRVSAYELLRSMLKQCSSFLLEPISLVTVRVSKNYLGAVMNDINSFRNGEVIEVIGEDKSSTNPFTIIKALIPLSKLIGYSTDLRSISAGNASFSMKTHSYKRFIQ